MIDKGLYKKYGDNGYKIIFSAGYSRFNEAIQKGIEADEKIYDAAKAAVGKGWNDLSKPGKTFEEVAAWLTEKGWIAAVLPLTVMAIDIDSSDIYYIDGKKHKTMNTLGLRMKEQQAREILKDKKAGIHVSNNGFHFILKSSSQQYKAHTKIFTRCGMAVTYRPGGKSNIIVAPSNNRTWETFIDNHELSEIPIALQPLDERDVNQVKTAVSGQLRWLWKRDYIQANEHIDMAFMGFLVKDLKYTEEKVHEFFEIIYRDEYEKAKTSANYKVVSSRDNVLKSGTFYKVCHDLMLNDFIMLLEKLIVLEAKKTVEQIKEEKNNNALTNKFARLYAETNNVIFCRGAYHKKHHEGYYDLVEASEIESVFTRWLGDFNFKPSTLDRMMKYVKGERNINPPENFVEFLMRDGKVLNTQTQTTRELTDKDYFFYKLNALYNPAAKCPLWLNFLGEIFPEHTQDHILFIQQFLGYIFYPKNKYELAIICRGEGANGKGVFMHVIEHIVGSQNCSNVGLGQFIKDSLLLKMQNKLLNMSTEVESKIQVCDNIFKQVVSGEKMTVDVKYKDAVTFAPFCKLIFSANNSVNVTDKSPAFQRRIIFLNFNVSYENSPKRDYNLKEKLCEEADGIFLWALEGLQKVLKQNQIIIPDALRAISKIEHKQNNTTYDFLTQYLFWTENANRMALIDEIYNEYKKFCAMTNHPPLAMTNFAKQMKREALGIEKFITRKGSKRAYRNVILKCVPYDFARREYVPTLENDININRHKSVADLTFEEYIQFLKEPF